MVYILSQKDTENPRIEDYKMFHKESCTYNASGEYVHPKHGSISKAIILETIDRAHAKCEAPLNAEGYLKILRDKEFKGRLSYEEIVSVSLAYLSPSYGFPLVEILMLANEYAPGIMKVVYDPQLVGQCVRFKCDSSFPGLVLVELEKYILRCPPEDMKRRLWFFLMLGLDIQNEIFLRNLALLTLTGGLTTMCDNLAEILLVMFSLTEMPPCIATEIMMGDVPTLGCTFCEYIKRTNYTDQACGWKTECEVCTDLLNGRSKMYKQHHRNHTFRFKHACHRGLVSKAAHIAYHEHIKRRSLFSILLCYLDE